MNWTENKVVEILEQNPHYEMFINEEKYILNYTISNIPIVIFNEAGLIEVYFKCYCYYEDQDILSARDFLRVAKDYFTNVIR